MKRFKHSLSHYKLLTCDMGELIPVNCTEVLPGDTVQQATSCLIRVSPLLAPVMHPVSVRIHHWYVPHRLVWAGWEDFITGGPDGIGGSSGVYPTITAGGGGFGAGTLADYFGIPPLAASVVVGAMPFRSFNLIYNEFYRDEDLITERAVPVTSGNDTTSPLTVPKVSWEKDYFTSARPWPQKGPAVTLPLGTSATIKTSATSLVTGAQTTAMKMRTVAAGALPAVNQALIFDSSGNICNSTAGGVAPVSSMYPENLFADLSTATAVNVNDVRRAFALQRYQEARAQYGSRYTEYLRYLGVRSSDARMQLPEYLGGGKQTISFTEVLQTGVTTSGAGSPGVGEMKGHGIAAMRSNRYRRFFEEHGIVISLLSVRPRTMYTNGQHRMWNRRTKEDYWQKELEAIGQQTLPRREIFAEAGAGGDTIFGYQDRYSEYRHIPSNIAGDFRTTVLNFWHLGRIFASAPTLNASFVECDPSKRINAVQTNDVLWVMCNNAIQARRMVGNKSIGRVL